MPAQLYFISVLFLIICRSIYPEFIEAAATDSIFIRQNPSDKQLLLNGRIWHNQYPKAFNDQFFLTNTMLKGSVTFNGKEFNNLDLKFDIASDELILSLESYPVISLNKEMVDSFSLMYGNRTYLIINAGNDSSSLLKGYVNLLYKGSTTLYVKYSKKIQPLAVDGRFDLFLEEHKAYLKTGTEIVPVKGKKRLLELLDDKKKELRQYIKINRVKVSNKDPNTYIPVIKYYDSLR
jgi:hypothetical protein